MRFGAKHKIRDFRCTLACAAFLASACGGRAAEPGNGPQSTAGMSSTGSSGTAAGGGPARTGDEGGAPTVSDGGATVSDGGSTTVSNGGSGAVGATSSAGSAQTLNCEYVLCAPIPATCKRLVQGPRDCCPTCPDTGCDACPDIDCAPGSHAETKPGACCQSCIADPPDACDQGARVYANLRTQLSDKYGSGNCKNSTECSLVNEDNACAHVCNIALPTQSINNYVSNLDNYAMGCATCQAPPEPVNCDSQMIAACVNGKCVGAEVGKP